MADVVGPLLGAIGTIVSKSWGAAHGAASAYDGSPVRWTTTLAAALAGALYVPMVVAACFAAGAVFEWAGHDFLWFLGLLLLLPALFIVAVAASAVAFGVTLGVWLLIGRPGARWYAGAFAAGGVLIGGYVLFMGPWVATVAGWSTIALGLALLVAVLLPSGEPAPPFSPAIPAEAEPLPALTQPGAAGRRRFVL